MRVLAPLLILELVLVYLDVTVTYYGASESGPLQDLCNLVIEGSIGGWLSSALTLLIATSAWLLARRESPPRTSARSLPGWQIIAAFFAFLALDDGSGLHEALGTAFEDAYVGAQGGIAAGLLSRFPSYPWQLLFWPLLVAGGAFTAWWSLRNLPRGLPRRLVAGGLLCFVFAVGLDFVEGLETPYRVLRSQFALDEITIPHFSGVLEEFIEMLGSTLILAAFCEQLANRCRSGAVGNPD